MRTQQGGALKPGKPTDAAASQRPIPWLWSIALAGVLLVYYGLLAPPGSGGGDSSEVTLVLATGGVLHPTGYPLFTMLGHLFVLALHALRLPFPYACALWSALGGGVAVLLLHRLALGLMPDGGVEGRARRFWTATFPVVIFGIHPQWVETCTLVEVYSWHVAWVFGAALYCASLIRRIRAPGGHKASLLASGMLGWGFLCGIGGSHHSTAVFYAGGLTLALIVTLTRARMWRWWIPFAWFGAGVLPFASYGYIAWKASHPGNAVVWPVLEPTLRGLYDHVSAAQYRKFLGRWNPAPDEARALYTWVFPIVFPGLALLGTLGFRGSLRREVSLGLFLACSGQLAFNFHYGVDYPGAYFLPCIGISLLALVPVGGFLVKRWGSTLRGRAGLGFAALGACIALGAPWFGLAREQWSGVARMDTYLESLWLAIPYDNAVVLWPDDNYYHLKEFQTLFGEKPGLDVYHTASLFQPRPRARFREKYGFDPLLYVDQAHLEKPVEETFVIGNQREELDRRLFALVHQAIAEHAGVPVVAFDPGKPLRAFLPKYSHRPGVPAAGLLGAPAKPR